MKFKYCTICKESKPPQDFVKRPETKAGIRNQCKTCHNKNSSKNYVKNLEHNRKRARDLSERYKDKAANRRLKRLFSISLSEYNNILVEQDFKCKICERPASDFKIRLHIDHCHKTGKIRGLLCYTCNSGLGYLKDSISLLFKAIFYLKNSRVS